MTVQQLHPAEPAERPALANYEAEQALLGGILTTNSAHHLISDSLRPEHFADPAHARIYAACARLIERGETANPVTLKRQFDADGSLQDVGGAAYLVRLASAIVNTAATRDYARSIVDLWLRRRLLDEGQQCIGLARDMDRFADGGGPDDLAEATGAALLERTERRLGEVGRHAAAGSDRGGPIAQAVTRLAQQVEAAHKAEPAARGASTGIAALDKALGPLVKSDLIILAARPSMGKTGLALNIADHQARRGEAVAFFSLEMSAEQLTARLIAERAGIPTDRQTGGKMGSEEWDRFLPASQDIAKLPIYIDDSGDLTAPRIRSRARRLVRQKHVGLVVVDYLQLINGDRRGREANRVQEISDITRTLKEMAKELNVPVLALSQLSRGVEDREDKRPQLRDLRDSGAIEQDADVVMFIHREAYYLAREKPSRRAGETDQKFSSRIEDHAQLLNQNAGRAELIIAKNRKGAAPRTVMVAFDAKAVKFSDISDDMQGDLPMVDGR